METKEEITLTLTGVNANVSNESFAAAWHLLTKDWEIVVIDAEKKEKGLKNGTCKTVSVRTWEFWHSDMLRLSASHASIVFEVVVKRPELKSPYKTFYHKGRTQLCETLREKFNDKKLV